ncbi:NAD(P)H-hydrate dehydratase [Methylophaga sp.]|uniref:NAD(P)H-hydrate dehydratase n=1 Tax=Methylophaga sp. TaxID=2024840 RepID=UPI0014017A5D|nr:NAD(P)H-hydrate dehydratase [Methylophaga sp.]MTI64174.1 NAD(P)H-hydrate dehydratase [Methylophaga sp.]
MLTLPHELYSAEQTRELDRLVIEQHRIAAGQLMARAGAGALQALKHFWSEAKQIVVVSGSGNNGGDGYELARQALLDGYRVKLFEVGHIDKMSDETRAAREALQAVADVIHPFEGSLPAADVVVDALFGTGLDRAVEGRYASAIEAINNAYPAPILSLDIPSGIHADTGKALGVAVRASVTLSFIGLNKGLFTGDAPDYCGQICFDSLQVPSVVYQAVMADALRIELPQYRELLSPRPRTAHKGLYGHLVVIGGDNGMPGAARVAAEAGARVGSGLVSIATHSAHSAILNQARPELMCHGIEHAEALAPLLDKASILAIGPGLGQSHWSQTLFARALDAEKPMVVDADALNMLSQAPQQRDNWILTPHPGEAARLLSCSSREIQANRFEAVQQLQQRYGGVIVLKGAGTLLYDGKLPIRLCTAGNPGMASGGMGDALTGVIGGLLAQRLSLIDAASLGVLLHAMAADKAAEKEGERGMLAMDLMPHLRHLVNLHY